MCLDKKATYVYKALKLMQKWQMLTVKIYCLQAVYCHVSLLLYPSVQTKFYLQEHQLAKSHAAILILTLAPLA